MNVSDPHKALAAALGRVASGIFVLTARQGEQTTGMLASWVQQCSFVPPLVSAAVQQGREILDWLGLGAPFTLNILDDTQTDMIAHFGKGFKPGEPAFNGLDVRPADGGGLVLTDALAYLECRVVARYATGDHHLLVAEVVRGEMLGEGHPMVHVRKSGTHY